MSHSHHHDHMHSHVTTNNKKVLFISFLIIGLYMFIEIIGGLLANSLALLSDGIHMFSDTFSLGVALIALYMQKRTPQLRKHLVINVSKYSQRYLTG